VAEDLTDRQRAALEAALYSGFFEWPRDASGEDVAEPLGIAPPTFHQHLRKAQRKMFEAVFSTAPAPRETPGCAAGPSTRPRFVQSMV